MPLFSRRPGTKKVHKNFRAEEAVNSLAPLRALAHAGNLDWVWGRDTQREVQEGGELSSLTAKKDGNSGQNPQIHSQQRRQHSSESGTARPTGGTQGTQGAWLCSGQGLRGFPLKLLTTRRNPLSGSGTRIPIHKEAPKVLKQNLYLM